MDTDTGAFQDNASHLFEELRRLDLLLRRAVLVMRSNGHAETATDFRGLVISEQETDRMLDSLDFLGDHWKVNPESQPLIEAIDSMIEKRRAEINSRIQASRREGRSLALPRIAAFCALSAAEIDILLIALAPELEPRYEALYAYLQNDVTRKRPSVDLALNLICRNKEEKLVKRTLFSPGAPLIHFGFLELLEESYDRNPTQLRQFLKLDASVLMYIVEQAPTAVPGSAFSSEAIPIAGLGTSTATRSQLENLTAALERGGTEHTIIHLTGPSDAPLEDAAHAIAHAMIVSSVRLIWGGSIWTRSASPFWCATPPYGER